MQPKELIASASCRLETRRLLGQAGEWGEALLGQSVSSAGERRGVSTILSVCCVQLHFGDTDLNWSSIVRGEYVFVCANCIGQFERMAATTFLRK